jgi:hypothetical protein
MRQREEVQEVLSFVTRAIILHRGAVLNVVDETPSSRGAVGGA